MSLKDLLNKFNPHVTPQSVQNTAFSIDRASQAVGHVAENVSDSGLLGKIVKTGTSAALAAGYLSSIIMPQLTAGVAAVAFLGASVYRYFSEKSQQAARAAILQNGLTPSGPAEQCGLVAAQNRQLMATKVQHNQAGNV